MKTSEGSHTGKATLWLRLFQCNLECRGFSQPNPADPDTYFPVGNDRDLIDIKVLEDLPVFQYGCDSAYSVSRRYEHLVHEDTANEIALQLQSLITTKYNPSGLFKNEHSGAETHMCFTGGEPLLRPNQRAIESIMKEFAKNRNLPNFVTVETNGTQKLSPAFKDFLKWLAIANDEDSHEWLWSISPKLLNTSGELLENAIKPEIVKSYIQACTESNLNFAGQLKFVVNNTQATWDELDLTVQKFRDAGIGFPVWIMPVGATKEQQETDDIKEIVYKALDRGFHVSGRLHTYMLGNGMGT